MEFPGGASGKESACQCRNHGFDPCVRKIPWRRKWQPALVFLAWKIPWTEEPGGPSFIGWQRVDMTEHAHTHTNYCSGFSREILSKMEGCSCLSLVNL